jgi:Zn-dependent protease with chaperone function
MLGALDRGQTQAVLGHLIGSIANGDLKLGLETLAVGQTFGFLMTLLEAPLNAPARKRLRVLARTAWIVRRPSAAERAALVAGFSAGLDPDTIEDSGRFIDDLDRPDTGRVRSLLLHLRAIVLLPLFGVVLVAKLFMLIATLLAVVPVVGWMLRHRRYLADATAVQLTRDPDALAGALAGLTAHAGGAGAGYWAPQLFVVAPGAHVTPSKALQPPSEARGMAHDTPLLLIGVQPPVASRLERLRALGARVDVAPPASPKPRRLLRLPRLPDVGLGWQLVTLAIVAIVLTPLVAFIVYLFGVALLFAGGVAIAAYWLALWAVSHLVP